MFERLSALIKTSKKSVVRKAVVSSMAITRATINYLIRRTRDIDAAVRKHTLSTVEACVPIRAISIAQRADILSTGLRDRDSNVVDACSSLLKKWLNSTPVDKDPMKLLSMIDVENYEEQGEVVIQHLITKMAEDVQIPHVDWDALTSESALYERVRCSILAEQKKDISGLPDASTFCEYLDFYLDKNRRFVVKQMLILGNMLEIGDEASRKRLLEMYTECLKDSSLDEDHAKLMLETFRVVFHGSDVSEYIGFMIQLLKQVYELIQFPTTQVQVSGSKTGSGSGSGGASSALVPTDGLAGLYERLNEANSRLKSPESKEEEEALMQQVRETRKLIEKMNQDIVNARDLDKRMWLRCLFVASSLFQNIKQENKQSQEISQGASEVLRLVLTPAIHHDISLIREEGVRALGLYCLLGKSQLDENLPELMDKLSTDEETVKMHVFKALLDVIFIFKADAITPVIDSVAIKNNIQDPPPITRQSIIQRLETFLDSRSDQLRTAAVEGFAKLLLVNKIKDEKILSKLFLVFFDPSQGLGAVKEEKKEEDDENSDSDASGDEKAPPVRDGFAAQILGTFFPSFGCSSFDHQALVARAVIRTMREFFIDCQRFGEVNSTQEKGKKYFARMAELIDINKLPETLKRRLTPEQTAQNTDYLCKQILLEILSDSDKKRQKMFAALLKEVGMPDELDENKLSRLQVKYLAEKILMAGTAYDFKKDVVTFITKLSQTPLGELKLTQDQIKSLESELTEFSANRTNHISEITARKKSKRDEEIGDQSGNPAPRKLPKTSGTVKKEEKVSSKGSGHSNGPIETAAASTPTVAAKRGAVAARKTKNAKANAKGKRKAQKTSSEEEEESEPYSEDSEEEEKTTAKSKTVKKDTKRSRAAANPPSSEEEEESSKKKKTTAVAKSKPKAPEKVPTATTGRKAAAVAAHPKKGKKKQQTPPPSSSSEDEEEPEMLSEDSGDQNENAPNLDLNSSEHDSEIEEISAPSPPAASAPAPPKSAPAVVQKSNNSSRMAKRTGQKAAPESDQSDDEPEVEKSSIKKRPAATGKRGKKIESESESGSSDGESAQRPPVAVAPSGRPQRGTAIRAAAKWKQSAAPQEEEEEEEEEESVEEETSKSFSNLELDDSMTADQDVRQMSRDSIARAMQGLSDDEEEDEGEIGSDSME